MWINAADSIHTNSLLVTAFINQQSCFSDRKVNYYSLEQLQIFFRLSVVAYNSHGPHVLFLNLDQ